MIATCILLSSLVTPSPDAAQKFLASLEPSLQKSLVLPFEDEYRTNARIVPVERKGVKVGSLRGDSLAAANDLLKAHLSPAGRRKIESIQSLEDVLREMENNPRRDKALYTYTYFGTPVKAGTWGWRFEGHHLSLNYTYKDGELVSSSPQFMGSNPAEVRTGPKKGTRVLAEESDLGFALLDSLSEAQRRVAVLGNRTVMSLNPGTLGLVTNSDRVAHIKTKEGLSYRAMTPAQRAVLMKLVEVFASVQRGSESKRRLAKIEKAGWNEVVFAWMGETSAKGDHYYRIQGPTFLIEFSNSQNDANHIHSVWRDFKGDFGRDVLGEHLASHVH